MTDNRKKALEKARAARKEKMALKKQNAPVPQPMKKEMDALLARMGDMQGRLDSIHAASLEHRAVIGSLETLLTTRQQRMPDIPPRRDEPPRRDNPVIKAENPPPPPPTPKRTLRHGSIQF
jgi:hypothetical protein